MRKSERGFIEVLSVIIIVVVILILTWIGSALYTMMKEEEAYGSKQGQIIDKSYHAAYTSKIYSGRVIIPQHHPASYRIRIQKDIDGELKSIWIDVDEKTYHEINIGDYYNKEE